MQSQTIGCIASWSQEFDNKSARAKCMSQLCDHTRLAVVCLLVRIHDSAAIHPATGLARLSEVWSCPEQVIGIPDAKYGEEVCAWVRIQSNKVATADELEAWCEGRLAAYKIPHYWKFVDSYPMTASGKVQKYLMRQQQLQQTELAGTGENKLN